MSFVLLLLLSCADAGVAATRPCGWYFTAGRGASSPVAWLSGVWSGGRTGAAEHVELVWTPLTGGTMLGMARTFAVTQHAPTTTLAAEFFMIRQEPDGTLRYVEAPDAPAPRAFALVESAADRAVFAHADGARVSLRLGKDGAGVLVLVRESAGERREWRLWREL